jgi:hypothetical protein
MGRWIGTGILVVMLLGAGLWGALTGPRVTSAQDSEETTIESLDSRVTDFFERFKDGTISQAFTDLVSGGPLASNQEMLANVAKDAEQVNESFGAYRGFEQIEARQIGKDMVIMKYLYKCESSPVVWYFTFYRPPLQGTDMTGTTPNEWMVIGVRFDTNLEMLAL